MKNENIIQLKKATIVVPCYNEIETLDIYHDEVIKYLVDGYDWKIILVNDGSKDNTLDKMKEIAEKDNRFLYLSFSKNFGKEAAMYAGLEAAKKINSDFAIIMDVDLQDPPRLIPEMVKAHEEGYNLINTRQKNRHGASKLSSFFSLSFYKVFAFFTKDKTMAKGARDYCLLDKKAIDAFLSIKDHDRFTKGIYHYVGFRNKWIEFDYEKRAAGTTKWNFRKLFRYALTGIKEFSPFYKYIPKLFAILTFILVCVDIVNQIINCVKAGTIDVFNWYYIRLDAFMFGIFFVFYFVIKLLYEIKRQTSNRPIYIEEESNIDETN